MHFSQVKILLVAAGAVHLTNAHTTFTNFFVDRVDQGDGTAVHMSNNIQQATYPLPNVTTPDMACGKAPNALSCLAAPLGKFRPVSIGCYPLVLWY